MKRINPNEKTVLIGGDHRFSYSLFMPYWEKDKQTGMAVFDDHIDNINSGELDFQSWLLYLPEGASVRIYSGEGGMGVVRQEFGKKLSKKSPLVISLCLDYLDSGNPLAATTSWVNLLADERKPYFFDGFEILEGYNIVAFHIAECRKDLSGRGGRGAVEELERLIKEFENISKKI